MSVREIMKGLSWVGTPDFRGLAIPSSRTFNPNRPISEQVVALPDYYESGDTTWGLPSDFGNGQRRELIAQQCKNCGAPLKSNICDHCDTRYL